MFFQNPIQVLWQSLQDGLDVILPGCLLAILWRQQYGEGTPLTDQGCYQRTARRICQVRISFTMLSSYPVPGMFELCAFETR